MESHYQPGSMERPQDQDLSAPCPDRQSRYTLKPVGAFVPCIFENWGVSSKLSIAGKSWKERGARVHVKLTECLQLAIGPASTPRESEMLTPYSS